MKKVLRIFLFASLLVFLTLSTQVGGVVLLLSFALSRIIKPRFRFKPALLFLALYALTTYVIVPPVAKAFGRVPVFENDAMEVHWWATKAMNRHYVTPGMNELLMLVHKELRDPRAAGPKIEYLDACFPFIDGFPLLPHLSHNDGRQLDIQLVWEDSLGRIIPGGKSRSGYGVFAEPVAGEFNQPGACIEQGHWHYDFTKHLTFGNRNADLVFSEDGSKKVIEGFLTSRQTSRIFLEPHLKTRLELRDGRIRFHGCHSVRHDDHIHVESVD